jgi:hypothetical protein
MKLSYSTTVEDWMAMARHATFSAQFRDDVFVWKWFFAIMLGATAAYVFADVSRTVGLGAGCVTLALVAWLYPRWARLGALAAFRRELSTKRHLPLFAAERSLEIRDEGLLSDSASGYQLVLWRYVESVEETPQHVFVRLPMRSAFVIPKQAIAPDTLAAFLEKLRARLSPAARIVG